MEDRKNIQPVLDERLLSEFGEEEGVVNTVIIYGQGDS